MNLAGFFSSKQTAQQELFFAIYFAEGLVRAALWEVADGQLTVLMISAPHAWGSEEEVIDATDRALQELGKESEQVKQTLFALEPTWVSQQGILVDKKQLFQKLTKELALEAVGFVVIPEAIVQDVIYRKGTAFQCFVVEILSERVSMTLLKNGKLGQQEMIGRSANVVDDIKEGFARFNDTPLPGVILLYSANLSSIELEEVRQRLLGVGLMEQFSFLQQPNIELIGGDQIIDTIVQTGGRAVAEAKELLVPGQVPVPTPVASTPMGDQTEVPLADTPEFDEPELAPLPVDPPPLGSDVLPVDPQTLTAQPVPAVVAAGVSRQPARAATPASVQPDPFEEVHVRHVDGTVLFGRLHLPHHPVLFSVIGVVLGVAALALIFIFSSGRMMSAQVLAELKTSQLNKQLSLRLDPGALTSDPTAGVLKAEIITQTATGEKAAATTGKKLIGEKAKGKVTIFNRTSSTKSFPAGTVLAAGGKKFLLDQSVTVASASTGRNFETKPGTLEAAVTAAAIGSDSNIAGDTELIIDAFAKDTYVARSNGAFAGGTSREIEAVSKKDQDELLAALRKELTDQAVEQLKAKVGEGKYVIPTNKTRVTSSKFSAEVGKETSSFTLSLTVEAEALSYSSSELQALAAQVLEPEVPQGYQIPQGAVNVNAETDTTATSSSQLNVKATFAATAKPNVNAGAWQQEILGKTEQEALELLRQKPEIAAVSIVRQPAFFAQFVKSLPKDPEQIDIQVK